MGVGQSAEGVFVDEGSPLLSFLRARVPEAWPKIGSKRGNKILALWFKAGGRYHLPPSIVMGLLVLEVFKTRVNHPNIGCQQMPLTFPNCTVIFHHEIDLVVYKFDNLKMLSLFNFISFECQ